MKKIICLVIAVVLCLSALTSCEMIEGVITDLGNNVFTTPEEREALDDALEYVSSVYKSLNGTHDKDFDVAMQAVIAGVKYPIAWTADSDKVTIRESVKYGFYTVDIPDSPDADLEFTLTAKITSPNSLGSRTKSFSIKVLSKNSAGSLSIPDAIELGASQGSDKYTETKYSVSGTIGDFYGNNGTTYGNFYLVDDNNNKILIYGAFDVSGTRYDAMSTKPTTGDKVTVYGVVGNYNGTAQLKDVTFTVINGVEQKVSSDKAVLSFADASNRVSINDNEQVWSANGITFTNNKASSASNVADYTNPIRCYKGSSITVAYTGMTKVEFVCAPEYSDTNYAGSLCNAFNAAGYSASVDGSIVTVVLSSATNSITATLSDAKSFISSVAVYTTPVSGGTTGGSSSCSHADNNGDFKCDSCNSVVAPAADSVLTIKQAIALGSLFTSTEYASHGTTDKYYITGKIDKVYDTVHGNMYLIDDEGNSIILYGCYGSDGETEYSDLAVKPVKGETIKVYGVVGAYRMDVQIQSGWVIEHTPHTHQWKEADCDDPKTCTICDGTEGKSLGHSWNSDNVCDTCHAVKRTGTLSFTFGANGNASHTDGNALGNTQTYENDGVKLTLTGMSKVYEGAFDAKGNSCLKLGTSSAKASLSFEVSEDVNSVVIHVAGYKAATSTKLTINGQSYTVTTSSSDGSYTAITIDTSTVKTISLTTETNRCMIDAIDFVY